MYKIVFKQNLTVDRKMMLNTVGYMDTILILYLKLQHRLSYDIFAHQHLQIWHYKHYKIQKRHNTHNVIDKMKKTEAP